MTLLLDTHILLWAFLGSPDLTDEAAKVINNPSNEVAFSVASIWEVAIKSALGRSDFHVETHEFRAKLLENGYTELPIIGRHILQMTTLPPIHKDPFDRVLVAQALSEGFTLLTSDPAVSAYPGPIRKI